jgi:phytoene dehydrogenase-like protein
MSLLHPKVIRDLGLRDLGLTVLPATDMFSPIGSDDYIVFSGDVKKTAARFARFSNRMGSNRLFRSGVEPFLFFATAVVALHSLLAAD